MAEAGGGQIKKNSCGHVLFWKEEKIFDLLNIVKKVGKYVGVNVRFT